MTTQIPPQTPQPPKEHWSERFLNSEYLLDLIATYWKHGLIVFAVLLLPLFSWLGYKTYQEYTIGNSAEQFQKLLQLVDENTIDWGKTEDLQEPYAYYAHIVQAAAAIKTEKYADALAVLDKSISNQPEFAQVLADYLKVQAYIGLTDFAQAIIVLDGFPEWSEFIKQELLGDVYLLQGDIEKAKTAYSLSFQLGLEQSTNSIVSLKLNSLGVDSAQLSPANNKLLNTTANPTASIRATPGEQNATPTSQLESNTATENKPATPQK